MMNSSMETSVEIHARRSERRKVFTGHRLFSHSIMQIVKENNGRTVNLRNISLSGDDGKKSDLQPCRSSPVEKKTETDDVKTASSQERPSQTSRILYEKLHQNHSSDSEKYSSCNENELVSRPKNKNYAHTDTHFKIIDKVKSLDKESEDCIIFKEIKHSRKILTPGHNLKITLKNDEPRSTLVTSASNSLSASSTMYNLQTVQSNSDFDKEQKLSSEEDSYIPPPVMSDLRNNFVGTCDSQISSNTVSEKYEAYALLNDNLEPAEKFSNSGEEIYFSQPDSDQIEAITKFILSIVKEKSVTKILADQVESDLNAIIREQLEGYRIEVYGSYFSDLAISTSDINLVLISDFSVRKSFMYELHKLLSEELKLYSMYPFEDGITAHQIKISFSHPDTGIKCQLAYLGKYRQDICKMGRFLRDVSKDERVKTLIVAAKIWSESLCINEVDDGKLHPIGYALMVLHFLQHCENPILSNFPCEKRDLELLPPNNSSVGELWLAFLKYYALTFNWKQDVITVESKESVSKKSKHWENYWIAVEDPFTGKNVAESVVNSDVADHIKACFKSSLEYFCNHSYQTVLNCTNHEDESNGDSSSCTWQFSFQQCIAEQSDVFCEDCDELSDVCDECQKKMYVQPMSSVPKMTESFLKLVKESLMTIYEKYILSDSEINERKMFVKKLQASVNKIYSDAELSLFGSSANGFGFKNSDLDICISFKSRKVINEASVLKDLRSLLRKDRSFDFVIAIFNASIPIVKFHYQPKGWRGDISLHNTLAIHNSNLLYTYSLLDERCKILGCALKLLAKKALITEVTEKALSSYSYLNMVIYFLQQIEPPVLPVLQDYKFRRNDFKIEDIVENCNVWFCDDPLYIKSIFKAENQTPVEKLWLDLLDYYCSYDYSKFISIRQRDPVYICENKRFARLFNIQDPFIETKNLGCVVSEKKAQETKSVLSRARILFRTPVKELPTCVKDIEDFFFSTQSLTGRIHKEALCDLCGKFGHEKKDCKQSCFPLRRFNFRQFAKQNTHQKMYPKQRPMNRGPHRPIGPYRPKNQ